MFTKILLKQKYIPSDLICVTNEELLYSLNTDWELIFAICLKLDKEKTF